MSFKQIDKNGNVKIECKECGRYYHQLSVHLKSAHGIDVAEYNLRHPGEPTISEYASQRVSQAQKGVKRTKVATDLIQQPEVQDGANGDHNGFNPDAPLQIGPASLYVRKDVTEADKKYIPDHDENYQLDMDVFTVLAVGIEEGDNTLVHGPTGCGKSAAFLELASILNQPVRRVNLNGDIRAADFTGEKVLDVDENGNSVVVWKDGVLPEAMRKGYWLLLDEMDAAQPHILFVLQAVLERGGKLTLTGNNGEVIEPHPNFRVVATANTIGRGDDTGLYTGTNVLNEAYLDRFVVVLKADYVEKSIEIKIVKSKTGADHSMAQKMVEVAQAIRGAFEQEQCYCTCSTRRLIEWAGKAIKLNNIRLAARITILDRMSKDDAMFVDGVIQRIMGC